MDHLLGLTLVAEGTLSTDRGVDIITIHGFEGYNSWKHSANGHEHGRESIFWLRDFLPIDLPSARIFTYGYRPSALCDGQGITQAADKLLDKLKNLQADNVEVCAFTNYPPPQGSRPLTFICHSLGGLLLKCALSRALCNKGDEALREIITATQGIIFLGTPHSTSASDLLASVSRIAAASKASEVTMVAIQSMKNILIRFASLTQQSLPWTVVHCYEELPLPGTNFRAVDPDQEESRALPPVSLYSHHLDLCRFATKNDLSYIKVIQSLRNITSRFYSSSVDEVIVHPTLSSAEDEVLESLETEEVSAYIRDPFHGTCDWILQHDAYKSWLETPSQPLWITGKPGSGKSTIMKFVNQHLRKHTSSRAVVYFFFSQGGANPSVTSLLSSLLYQLLKSTPSPRTFEIFSRFIERKEHLGSDIAWNNDILADNLLRLVDKSTTQGDSLFFFIDGLDKYDEPNTIFSLFRRLSAFSPGRRIWVCVSSRPNSFFKPVAEIRMEDNNLFDIRWYLCNRLLALENHLSSTCDVEKITQNLTEKSQGVFLWASLIVSYLHCDSYSKVPINRQSPTRWLPMGLEAAYETILRRLWTSHDVNHRKAAQDAFILVLYAQRPLSILELQGALAATNNDLDFLAPTRKLEENHWYALSKIHERQGSNKLDMTAQLTILCGGLLEVSTPQSESTYNITSASGSTVHFIHQTARDFLLEKGSWVLERDCWASLPGESHDSQELQLSQPHRRKDCIHAQCHLRVAWICLVFVNDMGQRSPLSKDQKSSSSTPFLGYSLSFGMLHLKQAEQMGVTPMTENMCQLPPFQKAFVDKWASMYDQLFENQKLFKPQETKAVHIMSYYGLPWYGTGLWGARLADINENDHRGRAPLSLAAAMGHQDTCQILIQDGADMSHRDHIYGQTALSYAAAQGHRDVVELLLRKGSDYDDHSSGVTPLWLAIRGDHLGVVKLLLETGADAKATSIHTGETCLSRAAALGNVTMASLLLQRGAEVDTRDKNGWTPLHHAVSRGRKKTIEVLLSVLETHQLNKLKASISKDKNKGSWITTVLRAIIIWACCQRGDGGESQTPPAGNQNTHEPSTAAGDRPPTKLGRKGHKHKLGSETDEDEYEEDETGFNKKRPRRSKPSGRRFACPYHRKNGTRFCSGACNGKGFEDISRLKTHLKQFHDRSRGWRRCHICQTRFPRDKLKGHKPCVERDKPTDYEEGFDIDQAEEPSSNKMRPSKSSEEDCWKAIFRVLFPDWPKGKDVPSPYQEIQIQAIPAYYTQAFQDHYTRMTRPNTIAELRASKSDEEFRQILEQHLGRFESDLRLPSMLPPGPQPNASSLSVPSRLDVPSTVQDGSQAGVRPTGNYPMFRSYPAPPERFFLQPHDGVHRSNLRNSVVSSSDANSSHVYPSYDPSDMVTENTEFSDLNSTGFGPFESWSGVGNNGDPAGSHFHEQMASPVLQPLTHPLPTGNLGHDPGLNLLGESQDCILSYVLPNIPHGSQQQPQEGLGQNNPPSGSSDEEQNLESALFDVGR
ncbi:hypothetical protein FDECE_8808 [Fusarium decemcellulare]|nr:hypothetical protein FDECE_8808 [Fusarium decemcellulare]